MAYLKIEWFNSVDYGSVLYQDGFKNRIYLDVELERPDYSVTIESDVNGDNQEIPKFRKWEKIHKFTVWMQEDLVDAFTFMSTCDTIEVTPQTGETLIVQPGSMRVEPEWEEAGCLAKVTVSFTTDYAAAGSCTENMDAACYCTTNTDIIGIRPVADLSSLGPSPGDYALGYTAETIANKRYTGSLYQYLVGWGVAVSNANMCLQNLEDTPDTYWFYDGVYWHLMPGYIVNLINSSGTNVMVFGWGPDGTFATIEYNDGGGWVEHSTVTCEGFDINPVTVDVGGSGSVDFRLKIWNHTCDYSYTEEDTIIIP